MQLRGQVFHINNCKTNHLLQTGQYTAGGYNIFCEGQQKIYCDDNNKTAEQKYKLLSERVEGEYDAFCSQNNSCNVRPL